MAAISKEHYIDLGGIAFQLTKITKKTFITLNKKMDGITGIPAYIFIEKSGREDGCPNISILPKPMADLDYKLRVYFQGCHYWILKKYIHLHEAVITEESNMIDKK